MERKPLETRPSLLGALPNECQTLGIYRDFRKKGRAALRIGRPSTSFLPPMGARTGAREAALQMLYAIEMTELGAEQSIANFWRELPGDAEDRDYADGLVRGIVENLDELDTLIRSASTHWRLERMARVDRNILRMGTYELKSRLDVPRAVVLDEAVELAKRFGTEESGAFVNGLLDRIATLCGRIEQESELNAAAAKPN